METPIILDRVHVIESPSAEDLFSEARYGERREGAALVSALRLAGIPVEHSLVVSENQLVERILDLAERPLAPSLATRILSWRQDHHFLQSSAEYRPFSKIAPRSITLTERAVSTLPVMHRLARAADEGRELFH